MRGMALGFVAAAASIAIATPAMASGSTYNHATLIIRGGSANALSACVNYARTAAHHHRVTQSNYCENFAEADGGKVSLSGVSVFIDQEGHSRRSVNTATIEIIGGDATAIAACVNVLQHTASARQTNDCSNTAVAQGGNVNLHNVDITVIQS